MFICLHLFNDCYYVTAHRFMDDIGHLQNTFSRRSEFQAEIDSYLNIFIFVYSPTILFNRNYSL